MTTVARRMRSASILLAIPASLVAQSRGVQGPTVFSPASQVGVLNVRAAIVLPDLSVKPLPLMRVVAQRSGGADSVAAQTGLEGTVVMAVPVGSYTVHATAPVVGARSFSWVIPVVVRQGATLRLDLTNATAQPDSVVVIAGHAGASAAGNEQLVYGPDDGRPIGGGEKPLGSKSDAPAARAAYRANTSGIFLGVGGDGSALRSGDVGITHAVGRGLSAQVGWGLTRHFAVYVEGATARLTSAGGTYRLRHVDAGARWHFVNPSRALVPFLDVAFSRRDAANVYYGNLPANGNGVTVGGGLQYFVARTLSLGTALRWTTGEFSEVRDGTARVDGFEIDAMSARADVGFSWYLRPTRP